jgi:hypothetical protein
MSKVAIAILVVLGMLILGYPRRDVVIAETDKIERIFGYELQFKLNLQLVKVRSADSAMIEERECAIVADTLEAP